MNQKRSIRALALWIVFFGVVGINRAEESHWLHDYNQARHKATAMNRPLLIDIGSDNCFWCKKLDATTLKHPSVTHLLRHGVVGLKVNASVAPALAKALGVTGYPTLVIASPQGHILHTQVGFVKADKLCQQLHRALAQVAPTEQQRLQLAYQATQRGDYPTAISHLQQIVKKSKSTVLQTKAEEILAQFESQAALQLGKARQLTKMGRAQEAQTVYRELLAVYPGTKAASDTVIELTRLTGKP